jgi:GNAT superfamily N-acetyltransferase
MDDGVEILPADDDDAEGIAQIIEAVWEGGPADPHQIVRALQVGDHGALVARKGQDVLGFVDAFPTFSPGGHYRWEVDLLAVHPDCTRRRIGARLVTESVIMGAQRGANLARSLVRVDNKSGERLFAYCAFQAESDPVNLFMAFGAITTQRTLPDRLHLIPVETFSYQGAWVEGEITPESLSWLGTVCVGHGGGALGVLIPVKAESTQHAAKLAGFGNVGRFRWWLRPIETGEMSKNSPGN